MKKFTLIISAIVITVASFAFVIENEKSFSAASAVFSEEPVLPGTPYAYSDITIPQSLEAPPNGGWGSVDPVTIDDAIATISDDGATLGRVLFYDEKLSASNDISCGSCHNQSFSFAEEFQFSEGVNEATTRNSMHLNDIMWFSPNTMFWDAKQIDLKESILLPLQNENETGVTDIDAMLHELSETTYYPELFENAFGDANVTEERVVSAIEQFLKSINSFNSKFDKVLEGEATFNTIEEEGRELFEQECVFCHPSSLGQLGIDFGFFPIVFDNGLDEVDEDPGMGEWMGDPQFNGHFKPPTLRNIQFTGPYMHDGRFNTLREVMDFYSDDVAPTEWGMIPEGGFDFSDHEKDALVAFLKTMSDQNVLLHPKWSDPFPESTDTQTPSIEGVKMFPNPMLEHSLINIDSWDGERINLNIVSMNGQVVFTDQFQSNQYVLGRNNLTAGNYVVRLQSDKGIKTLKLSIQ